MIVYRFYAEIVCSLKLTFHLGVLPQDPILWVKRGNIQHRVVQGPVFFVGPLALLKYAPTLKYMCDDPAPDKT